jgi:hypothetical protein
MSEATAGGGPSPIEPTVEFLSALVEALPAGAFVIDAEGAIRYATPFAAELVDREANELVGRSVLEFVDEDTVWAYAAAVAMAGDHPDVVMGPMRVTIVGAGGQHRRADLWAMNRFDDPAVRGIVCLLTPETAAVGLAEAVSAIANDAEFTVVANRVVRAMRGHPTACSAALVAVGPSGYRVVAASEAGLPDIEPGGPWDAAVERNVRQLPESVEELEPPLADVAQSHGFGTVWAEPVGGSEPPARGVLVLWRDHPGRPTPNELNAVHQAAAILSLAWDLHESVA